MQWHQSDAPPGLLHRTFHCWSFMRGNSKTLAICETAPFSLHRNKPLDCNLCAY